METNKKQAEAQGAEPKKKQAKSVTYALRAIHEHVRTLKAAKLVTVEEESGILNALENAGSKYLKGSWLEGIAE